MENLKDAIVRGLKQHELKFNTVQIDEIIKKLIPSFNKCIAEVAFKDQAQSIGDNITDVIQHDFIAEIMIDESMFAGFDGPRNMSNFANKFHMYPIYQIIFEDKQQKLVFEYLGETPDTLEKELSKLYPNKKIDITTHDDVIIGIAYPNYKQMNDEFDTMKERLTDINPKIARQCRRKELVNIPGSNRQVIKSRFVPQRSISMVIHIDNLNITNCAIVGTMNGGNINIEKTKTREEIHREWIEVNPPGKGESSSKYYNRLKQSVNNPVSIQKHAQILRKLNYTRIRNEKGSLWVKAN